MASTLQFRISSAEAPLVLVTGANGMLGTHICLQLREQGYRVRAFCLSGSCTKTITGAANEIQYGDVRDEEALSTAMSGSDYAIHAAGSTSLWPGKNRLVNEINITGTRNVMHAAERANLKRLVHIGSASSFGGEQEGEANEYTPYSGWRFRLDYMNSKYIAQKMLLNQYTRTGFPVVVVNPTFMIGAFDSGPTSGQILLNLYKNKLPGYTNGGKNFVCTADVAVAAVNALKLGAAGSCYIAGNQNMSYREFFEKVSLIMQRPFSMKRIPAGLALSAGIVFSISARVTGVKPPISYSTARLAQLHQWFECSKAVRELRMPQTPVETGIVECLKWFAENGYLD